VQLTRGADYGVRVMIHLATLPPGSRVSRTELAAAVDCPEQFLSKVLQSLAKAGLVTSHRGNTGGFQLPEARVHTTMLEIVEAVEGPVRLNLCLASDHSCEKQGWCPAHGVWADAQIALAAVLRGATLADLAKRVNVHAAPPVEDSALPTS
jgi:Rrf2 family protein